MIQMNVHQLAAIVGGSMVGKEARIQGVTTDSRGDCQGKLFVALRGEFFNGEDFCQVAVQQGAAAVMVAHAVEVDVPQLIVKDTLVALQAIATAWVKQTGVKVIGVTGSNGKTTVKNMLLSVLRQKYRCHATSGNYNNEIGVPLSLLSIAAEDEVAVIEMGAAKVGDIAFLTRIIRPHVALVTNVGNAHVGRFGSVDNIAQGKGEIYEALDRDGLAVINADSPYAEQFKARVQGKVMTFGEHEQADFRLLEHAGRYQVVTRRGESFDLDLPVLGFHNYLNATAVVAIALSLQVSFAEIAQGLLEFEPEAGRLQIIPSANALTIIDDSYNANPAAVNAAIDVLKTQSGPTVLILGDMAELGEYAAQMHQQVGSYACQQGINQVLAVGEYATQVCQDATTKTGHDGTCQCQSFAAVDELMAHLQQHRPTAGTVLIKGSRSMRLERVIPVLSQGAHA
ncbi:UDP-N-acetylmuramoyl-tripeptide--D-alanyl-D-alanine ligase [Marinicella meishanensis]|uniref:UDP-N-acetylmuramoyl-tripeptide--D-alanyl-D- alanine ligase n=1 Tax=Marinicella meishanensis TaxID=2873263 RepID=UPI001CC1AEFD|nr:UDP-N-acetylmuramoyl-tripeptide--D-alanyl-D-alanine ligase [Marinicella sp. NBU2979]